MFTLKVYTGNSNIVIKVKHENENITRINNEVSKKISNANQSDLVAVFFSQLSKVVLVAREMLVQRPFLLTVILKSKFSRGRTPFK